MTTRVTTTAALDGAIARLARTPRLLVALDFDGTLSPLVDEPMAARMLPEARAAIDALAAAPRTTVALVSGRTVHDLRIIAEHADDSPVLLAGSHGAEEWPVRSVEEDVQDAASRTRLALLSPRVAAVVAETPGAWLEPKEFGFAVHTRRADPGRVARTHETIDELMRVEAPEWRRRTGRDILEFSYRHDGKDAAVARLRAQVDATAVLFAGDDVTDEDALRTLGTDDVGVRVGPGETAAAVRVEGIPQLAAMLVRLARERDLVQE